MSSGTRLLACRSMLLNQWFSSYCSGVREFKGCFDKCFMLAYPKNNDVGTDACMDTAFLQTEAPKLVVNCVRAILWSYFNSCLLQQQERIP